jgi:MoxR-like ATPase
MQTEADLDRLVGESAEVLSRVAANVAQVVRTPPGLLERLMMALVAEGHILIEDVPGVGKTLLARSLARSLDMRFSRIQGTPDLLPGDVTGVEVYDQSANAFVFRPGAIFANLVLVDEINRTSPKTQAALLESMQERQVTVDGVSRALEAPFIVIATENPIEFEGTFPLPEAQLDRFAMVVRIGYPGPDDEARMLAEQAGGDPLERLRAVADAERIRTAITLAAALHVDESIHHYAVSLLARTRSDPRLALGASPRAGVGLLRLARALALLSGRSYVLPDDVRDVAELALGHRVIVSPATRAGGVDGAEIVREIVAETPIPR